MRVLTFFKKTNEFFFIPYSHYTWNLIKQLYFWNIIIWFFIKKNYIFCFKNKYYKIYFFKPKYRQFFKTKLCMKKKFVVKNNNNIFITNKFIPHKTICLFF